MSTTYPFLPSMFICSVTFHVLGSALTKFWRESAGIHLNHILITAHMSGRAFLHRLLQSQPRDVRCNGSD